MKNRILWIGIAMLILSNSFAQNAISGKVIDENKQAVFLATLALYQEADSLMMKAVTSDERGRFEIIDIPDGRYYLVASMIGAKRVQVTNISLPNKETPSFELQLLPDVATLSTVEVKAKIPLLEQQSDRLVVNIENNLTHLNNNLLDVMKQIPGMIVINDNLRMAGQSNFTILINGKTTRFMDVQSLLRDMPGDNVKKVEVIHQPGAEFEASGTGPIINIVLKKNSLHGTNGQLSLGVGKDQGWTYNPNLSLSHYEGKVNINGSMGYSSYTYLEDLLVTRRINGDVYDQRSFDPPTSRTFRTSLSADWDINDRQRFGIASRYSRNRTVKVAENTTKIDFLSPEKSDLDLFSINDARNGWDLIAVNPYYHYEFDTTGHKLELDVNYIGLQTDGFNTLETQELNEGSFFPSQRFSQPGEVSITATRLDYTYPFSKLLKWQGGVKYSHAKLDNDLQSSIKALDEVWRNNPLQSNHFVFDERIAAIYSKFNFKQGPWSGTFGLRYEDSQSEGYSVTLDSSIQRNIAKLFPSFSLAREITKELAASVAYSYRIERPQYSTLNPFVYYWDPYTYDKGNPLLVPALTHSMKFNLIYDDEPFFNVEYKISENPMVDVTEQNDATGEAYTTVVNLASQKLFNASLFFPLDFIPGVDGFAGVIANHTAFDSEYLSQQFIQSGWSLTGYMEAGFTLPGKIETELTAWYNSGGPEGIMDSEWIYGVSIGVGKKFLDNKAKISLGVEDIFRRFWHAKIDYANMDVDVVQKWYTPSVSMRLSYKFGNPHMKTKRKHQGSAADAMNRVR